MMGSGVYAAECHARRLEALADRRQAKITELETELTAAKALSEDRRKMLSRLQWATPMSCGIGYCPHCEAFSEDKVHAADCALARLIREDGTK